MSVQDTWISKNLGLCPFMLLPVVISGYRKCCSEGWADFWLLLNRTEENMDEKM